MEVIVIVLEREGGENCFEKYVYVEDGSRGRGRVVKIVFWVFGFVEMTKSGGDVGVRRRWIFLWLVCKVGDILILLSGFIK